MSPFDREPMTSLFYSNYGSISCRFWDIQCRQISPPWIPVKGQSRSLKVVPFNRLGMVSYYCSIVTLSLRRTVFLDIRLGDIRVSRSLYSYTVTLKPGLGSLKIIGTDTDRSATYDSLLMFHSNHGPISYCFRDKWRFQTKIEKEVWR